MTNPTTLEGTPREIPSVGAMAPEVALPDENGIVHHLTDQRGRWTILYFYPEDDTSGCTKEACQFRDIHEAIVGSDADVWGVSPDDAASHERFKTKYGLPFTLLSDVDRTVINRYGAWGEKDNYGKKYLGLIRSSFLIDPDGRIAKVWPRVTADGHAAKVFEALTEAKSKRTSPDRTIHGSAMTEAAPVAHEWRPRQFMVIAAHPDDADFGPAGTSARWIDAGSSGWLVCCTSGDQGGEDPDIDPLQLALTREAEQSAAARVVGYAGVSYLHQPDGALANDLPLREQLVREIRTFRPDAVLTHDPDVIVYARGGINHTDHRAAGIAAIDAVYPAARNPMAFPNLARNGLEPQRVHRVYLFWPNQPDTWIDTSATVGRKVDALRQHVSQLKHPDELAERILSGAAETGTAIGAAAAEAFRVVVIDDDEEEGPAEAEGATENPT